MLHILHFYFILQKSFYIYLGSFSWIILIIHISYKSQYLEDIYLLDHIIIEHKLYSCLSHYFSLDNFYWDSKLLYHEQRYIFFLFLRGGGDPVVYTEPSWVTSLTPNRWSTVIRSSNSKMNKKIYVFKFIFYLLIYTQSSFNLRK